MPENSVVPLIPLRLDKLRYLRLDITALCQAELDLQELWGREISVYEVLLKQPMRLNDISILVLHALRHADPTLSLPEVKGMLNHTPIFEVIQAVMDAWMKSTPPSRSTEGEQSPLDPPSAASTGDNSGPMPALTLDSVTESSGV